MSGELAREWVKRAEEDWTALTRLREGGLAEVAGVISFHAQQCAEKYLKALLQRRGIEPPRIHQLSVVLDMLTSISAGLEELRHACEELSPYAVTFRYPGGEVWEDDAREALRLVTRVRTVIRKELGLESA